MDWLLQRAKAFVALAAPGITAAALSAGESAFGVTIPAEIKVTIISAVTGLLVHQVPNKAVTK